jgi:hypothetical protein
VQATLGDFFDLWGQPLSRKRALSFPARRGAQVAVFVNGKRWGKDPRSLPLSPRQAIVLEVGGYFPPTRHFVFPSGL